MRRLSNALKKGQKAEKTWILCINLWGARLFEHVGVMGDEEVPRFVAELPRPSQLLPDEDFPEEEDIPEVTSDPKRLKWERRVAAAYCTKVTRLLEDRAGRFDALVICAEPTLLEILAHSLPRKLHRKLRGTISQDLYEINETDLASYWRDLSLARLRRTVA